MSSKTPEINPFSINFKIYTEYKITSDRVEEGSIKQITYSLVETDKKTSLYRADTFEIMRELSGNARLVFLYIATHIGWNSEKIELKPDKMIRECRTSKATYYRSIEELKTMSLIVQASKRKDMYWVNPRILFHGNRIKVFKDNVVRPVLTSGPAKESDLEKLNSSELYDMLSAEN